MEEMRPHKMKVIFSEHAKFEIARRKIAARTVGRMLEHPQQEIVAAEGKTVIQGKYRDRHLGKEMLLRIIGRRTKEGFFVITAYKTSRIGKYWKSEDRG